MTRKKIKFSHTKWLLPLWVLLIGSIVLYMIAHAVQQDDSRHLRTLAELNAVTYGDSMIADLNAGINITDTLEQLLISADGRIDKFDTIADRMMADYVQSIQLAPGGVVTDVVCKIYLDRGSCRSAAGEFTYKCIPTVKKQKKKGRKK